MAKRHIAIVGDGSTDIAIFLKIAEVLLSSAPSPDTESVEINRKTLHDSVERYWQEATRINQYYLPSQPALTLESEAMDILQSAFADFEAAVGVGILSNRDVLLVTTDAERSRFQTGRLF